MPLVYIEWPSWFWKSFTAKKLDQHKVGIRVWEYHDYLQEDEGFSNVFANNKIELDESRNSLETLITRRSNDILSILNRSAHIFVERSPLTFLYTEVARHKHGLHTNIIDMSKMILRALTDQEDVENYIILATPIDEVIQRLKDERWAKPTDFFYTKSVITNMFKVIEFFVENYLHTEDYIKIQSNQNIDLITEQIDLLLDYANRSKNKSWSHPVRNFCEDIIGWLDIYNI